MEEFFGYSDDSEFSDLREISSKSSDLLDNELNSFGGYSGSANSYDYSIENEPIYSGNNENLIADVLNTVDTAVMSSGQLTNSETFTDSNAMESVGQIGCGCSGCDGGRLANFNSSGGSLNISADAIVGGVSGKDALDSGFVWANDGTGLDLTFNFITSLPGYYAGFDADLTTGFQAMNANQAAASREVLDIVENYINVTFTEVGSGATADMAFGQVSRANVNIVAHAYYPTGSPSGGDVFLNTSFWGYDSDPNYGDLVYQTIFHEVGHALGLKHSFDASRGSGDVLQAGEENNNYSVMSYTDVGGYAGSMMMHDIAYLQELYGVNTNFNTGNDTYNITAGTHFTIWDAGGTDTLSGAGQNTSLTIRLEDGTLSEIGSTRIGIAFNAEIENATGGNASDTIYGNELNNVILGGNGDDTFYGSLGDDSINGQVGSDTIHYGFAANEFVYNFINGTTVAINHLVQGFTDTLSNIETFLFNGISYTFSSLQSTFANEAPTISVTNLSLGSGSFVLASSVINANDVDGDVLTYTVFDSGTGANSGYFELAGVELAANQNHVLTEAEFATLRIVGGSDAGTETLRVRVSDGSVTTDWEDIQLTSGVSGNVKPEVSANNIDLSDGANVLASTVITASDVNGDVLTYTVWDAGKGNNSGYFDLNGTALSAGSGHTLTAAEFAQLRIVGGSDNGKEKLWVQVSDGTLNTSWVSFNLNSSVSSGVGGGTNTASNTAAPVVTLNDLSLASGETALASSVISASDVDNNPLTYYLWDGGKAGNSGYFELGGSSLSAGISHELTQAEFEALNIVGGANSGSEKLWVRVSDGENLTAWSSLNLTSSASGGSGVNLTAPTVNANDLSLEVGESALASTTISANDADGNPLTYYVWDAGGGGNSGYFELNGVALSAGISHTLTATEFSQLNIVGGSVVADETMWVRVSDGINQTAWQSFTLSSSAGGGSNVNTVAPTVTANNLSLDIGASVQASSVINANDADGNTLTYYVWDAGKSSNSGYFDLDGTALATGRSIELSQAEFDNLDIVGGNAGANETLWIKVSDGTYHTGWVSFTLTSTGQAPGMEVAELIDGNDGQDDLGSLSAQDQSILSDSGSNLTGGLSDTAVSDLLGDQSTTQDIV
ncbi:MAG: M10 family metallopeptidase C-terminal domain-containing protein [Pseudomonadota bacterium]